MARAGDHSVRRNVIYYKSSCAARRAQARQCGVGNKERCEAGVHRFIMGRHMHAAMDSLHFGTGVPVQLQQHYMIVSIFKIMFPCLKIQ